MASAKRELPVPPPLYETDFYSWALEQGALLRERRLSELDLDNLIDEVEALARTEARELESRYGTLLQHLLKWEFQTSRRSNSWAVTIRRERDAIPKHLAKNPGLKPRRAELFAEAYDTGRADAAIETDLPLEHFPADNPYTLEQAMDAEFWPRGREMPARETGKRPNASSRERT
jgi:hypothetical protein